ncbi:hypothetical protein BCU24_21125 [Vibrio cyclitrophicus]|uniref:glycosyltransferase family 2 protein n=1 Tax=Vibrio cyclitrophicus TaxID=47951 RepID=UPI000C816C77|nr:glycosyltransferase family 2 protein [Vibrio cyclitrophicus]PMJ21405.1 hypothetical protein BCU28_10455 [Vibrio cyclitrophicus]PMJ38249.1 hypothetical protein BCU24_21125 [Vibrio cyclitrophicus]
MNIFSIIIVNYKSVDLVSAAIRSIVKYSSEERYEVIVVDNASGDDLSVLESISDVNLKLLYNSNNQGFGSAINFAVKKSSGDYFLLLNPDAYFCSDVLAVISDFYDSSVDYKNAIVGGSIFNEKGSAEVSYGNFPSMHFDLLSLFGTTKLFPCLKRKYSTSRYVDTCVKNPFLVDYVSGALCCIPRNIFSELNGFDTDFFLYFEETELLRRHYVRGGKCYVLPLAKIIHKVSSVTGDNSDFKIRNLEIGRYLYFKKTSRSFYFFLYKPLRASIMLLLFLTNKRELYLDLFLLWVLPKFSKAVKQHHSTF